MTTLELIKEDKVMLAIVRKLAESNVRILKANDDKVKVKANCLPVGITWEMCGCHGGRMWFNQDNTNIHIELSSDKYDEENGVTDPETELAYYIDNKMLETIHDFERYVYVVEVIGEYKDGKVDTCYFKSVEDASRRVFEEDGHDVNSEYGTVIHQYPNPDIQAYIQYVGDTDGVIEFKKWRVDKGEKKREYTVRYKVFRKR